MIKNDLELFKQAVSEGLNNRFDSVVNECTEKIVYSEKHRLAMRTIIYGKNDAKRVWSPKMKRIIAILIAAALLLTSCGIIFRNEIREVFEEFFVKLSYDGDNESTENINDVYYLSYVPEGYVLEKEKITPVRVQYEFSNKDGKFLFFEQRAIISSDYVMDIETGYSRIMEIEKYDVYHRATDDYYHYAINDGKYSVKIRSTQELSNEEIILILDGIRIK
jgi:uncharacterized protein YxeA